MAKLSRNELKTAALEILSSNNVMAQADLFKSLKEGAEVSDSSLRRALKELMDEGAVLKNTVKGKVSWEIAVKEEAKTIESEKVEASEEKTEEEVIEKIQDAINESKEGKKEAMDLVESSGKAIDQKAIDAQDIFDIVKSADYNNKPLTAMNVMNKMVGGLSGMGCRIGLMSLVTSGKIRIEKLNGDEVYRMVEGYFDEMKKKKVESGIVEKDSPEPWKVDKVKKDAGFISVEKSPVVNKEIEKEEEANVGEIKTGKSKRRRIVREKKNETETPEKKEETDKPTGKSQRRAKVKKVKYTRGTALVACIEKKLGTVQELIEESDALYAENGGKANVKESKTYFNARLSLLNELGILEVNRDRSVTYLKPVNSIKKETEIECPHCESKEVRKGFKFCPDCGGKLNLK